MKVRENGEENNRECIDRSFAYFYQDVRYSDGSANPGSINFPSASI